MLYYYLSITPKKDLIIRKILVFLHPKERIGKKMCLMKKVLFSCSLFHNYRTI